MNQLQYHHTTSTLAAHPVALRRISHRGTVEAMGLLVGTQKRDQKRILELWKSDCTVVGIPEIEIHKNKSPQENIQNNGDKKTKNYQYYAIFWPEPRRMRADQCGGIPLVGISLNERETNKQSQQNASCLASMPLYAHEKKRLQLSSHDIVIAQGGYARVYAKKMLDEIDLSTWIDVSAFSVCEMTSLGAPAKIDFSMRRVSDADLHARWQSLLGAPPSEQTAVLDALRVWREQTERNGRNIGDGANQNTQKPLQKNTARSVLGNALRRWRTFAQNMPMKARLQKMQRQWQAWQATRQATQQAKLRGQKPQNTKNQNSSSIPKTSARGQEAIPETNQPTASPILQAMATWMAVSLSWVQKKMLDPWVQWRLEQAAKSREKNQKNQKNSKNTTGAVYPSSSAGTAQDKTTTTNADNTRNTRESWFSLQSVAEQVSSWEKQLRAWTQAQMKKNQLGKQLGDQLSKFLGKAHAEYVDRMMKMFDEGNLDEALRHAIPIDDKPSTGNNDDVTWSMPRPKMDLRIPLDGMFSGSGSYSMPMGSTLLDHMRRAYERALDDLKRKGRIKEAVYVLVHLLGRVPEAIALLEEHHEYRIAAEIAESRYQPAGVIIRLWMLAKDHERAVAVARRYGAFSDAIVRLQEKNPEEAKILRVYWAQLLAESGQFLQAVDASASVAELDILRQRWMEIGIDAGGIDADYLLPKYLATVMPSGKLEKNLEKLDHKASAALDKASQYFQRAILADGFLGMQQRVRLADAWVRYADNMHLSLATQLLRTLMNDVSRKAPSIEENAAEILQGSAIEAIASLLRKQSSAFSLDSPPLPPKPTLTRLETRAAPLILVADIPAGNVAVMDAALLPHGRILLALGEGGAVVWGMDVAESTHSAGAMHTGAAHGNTKNTGITTKTGKIIHRYDEPAQSIVMSDTADRALLVMPRQNFSRVTMIDFAKNDAAIHFGDLPITTYANSYDGSIWYAGMQQNMAAYDMLAKPPKIQWRVQHKTENLIDIHRQSHLLGILWEGTSEAYVLPTGQLQWRRYGNYLGVQSTQPTPPLPAAMQNNAGRIDSVAWPQDLMGAHIEAHTPTVDTSGRVLLFFSGKRTVDGLHHIKGADGRGRIDFPLGPYWYVHTGTETAPHKLDDGKIIKSQWCGHWAVLFVETSHPEAASKNKIVVIAGTNVANTSQTPRELLHIYWPQTKRHPSMKDAVKLRVQQNLLMIVDTDGRLCVIEMETGRVVVKQRVCV